MLTEQELLDIASAGESDCVEFKRSLAGSAKERIMEAICAFANDLPGHGRPGVVVVGVNDDGTLSGAEINDKLLQTLADMRSNGNILPLPSMTVGRMALHGGEVAVVQVRPSDSPPVRCRGAIHIRTGARRGIASAQDERILGEKRRYKDVPYDIKPLEQAGMDDLDLRWFELKYLPAAFAEKVLAANNRTTAEQLKAVKMAGATVHDAGGVVPTVLGIVTAGKRPRDFVPGAYIQFLKFGGRELGDTIIDNAEIQGLLEDVVKDLDRILRSHNREAIEIAGHDTERRTAMYPMEALQQLTRNAIMHRSYEGTNSPVRVHWYRDRIEITNSGGAFGEVAGHLGEPGLSDYRNPNLAAVMRDLDMVQGFGLGIKIARDALQANGNPPPEFHEDDTRVRVTVHAAMNIHRCHFKLGNKIVHTGITPDPHSLEAKLRRRPGWGAGRIKTLGAPVTRDDAVEWQHEQRARGRPTAP